MSPNWIQFPDLETAALNYEIADLDLKTNRYQQLCMV